jgi:hypothetical protein
MAEIYYEPGRYRVEIIGASLGESKGGQPQIELGMEIQGMYDGPQFVELRGPGRTCYLSITEKTMGTASEPGWVWQTLVDLGFKGPSLTDLAPLVGAVRDAEMKVEDYNGQQSEKWNVYRRWGTQAQRPVEGQKARQLDAKFRGLLTLVKPVNGAAAATIARQRDDQGGEGQAGAAVPAPEPRPTPAPATRAARPMPVKGRRVEAPQEPRPMASHIGGPDNDIPF